MKRFLSFALAVIVCLSVVSLVACNNGDNGGNGGQQPAAGTIKVADLVNYYIVRADVDSLTASAIALEKAIKEKIATEIAGVRTDFILEGNDKYSVKEFEILIGETNRQESIEFAAEIKQGEYGYAVKGDKIVIIGKPVENNALAVEKFITDIITPYEAGNENFISKDAKFIQTIEYKFNGLTINGIDISEFDIVYKNTHGASEEIFARQIQDMFAKLTGVNVNVLPNTSTSAKANQIVINNGKAITSEMKAEKEELAKTTNLLKNGVVISGGNVIWFYGDNISALKAAVDNFINMVDTSDSGEFTITSGVYEPMSDPIKVMSFNVYVGTKYDSTDDIIDGGPAQRRSAVISTILSAAPDVFGVQEASNIWITYLNAALKETYGYVGTGREPTNKGSSANEGCQIFYNKEKYTVIDTNTYWLSETPDVYSRFEGSEYPRIVTYAIFERKSDGFRFMHVNTHLDFSTEVQKKQINKMMELVEAVGFDGLTVYTGDFNMNSSSQGYTLMNNYGCINSFDLAQISTETSAAGMIDFCFVQTVNPDVVSEHVVVRETFNGLYPSDHRAVYSIILPSIKKD